MSVSLSVTHTHNVQWVEIISEGAIFLASHHFAPDVLARNVLARVILARLFHLGNILVCEPFGPTDVPADGHFNTETFDMGTFRHRAFSA